MTAGVLSPRTILIIDDSDAVLAAARSILARAGYRVITRNRPSGSITAILNEKPDVVLLDLNMPTLSGEAILKVFSKTQNRPDTMVLLHSSLPLETLRLKAMSAGAHGYIQKTDNSTEILRRLEYWIRRTHQTNSARMRASEARGDSDPPLSGRRDSSSSLTNLSAVSASGPSSARMPIASPTAPSPAPSRKPIVTTH